MNFSRDYRVLFGIFVATLILAFEYRLDQVSRAPLSFAMKLKLVVGDWEGTYKDLQTFRSPHVKTNQWPQNFSDMDELLKIQPVGIQLTYRDSTQDAVQKNILNYLMRYDPASESAVKSSFSLFAEFPDPETTALAVYAWKKERERGSLRNYEMQTLFELYLTSLDLKFADRAYETANFISDDFSREIFQAFAKLSQGNGHLAQNIFSKKSPKDTQLSLGEAMLLSDLAGGMGQPILQTDYLKAAMALPTGRENIILALRGYNVFVETLQNHVEGVLWLKNFSLEGDEKNWLNYWLGKSYEFTRQLPEAEAAFSNVGPEFRFFDQVLEAKAGVLNELKKYKEAVAILQDLNQRKPSQEIKIELAHGLKNTGNPSEAEKLLNEVISQVPQHFEALYSLGQLQLYHLGKFEEANLNFQKALKLKPGDPQLLRTLGDLSIARTRGKQ